MIIWLNRKYVLLLPQIKLGLMLGSDILEQLKYDILIVDDIPDNLELLSNILEMVGLDVRQANGGMAAISQVMQQRPDLILLDISMPEIDGYEVCRRLKNNADTHDIPIIFLTALNDSENVVKGFKVGGQDYVTKPFNAEELLARVKTHLELKEKKEEIIIISSMRFKALMDGKSGYTYRLLRKNDIL